MENPLQDSEKGAAVVSQPAQGVQYGEAPAIPVGRWRSKMCDACTCPHCCMALFCPYIIFAQAHKKLWGGDDPKKGMIGFYVIIIGFVIFGLLAAFGLQQFAELGWLLGVFVVASILRRLRTMYQIKGDCDECRTNCPSCNFCGCCNDGCCDVSKAIFCQCCAAYQIGNHLFDYSTNNEMTYEPVPTHFVV